MCDSIDCGNHGTCIEDEGSCTCTNGYTGDRCEVLPDPCEYPRHVDCGAHGVCGCHFGQCGCNCTDGYTGSSCETGAWEAVCLPGGSSNSECWSQSYPCSRCCDTSYGPVCGHATFPMCLHCCVSSPEKFCCCGPGRRATISAGAAVSTTTTVASGSSAATLRRIRARIRARTIKRMTALQANWFSSAHVRATASAAKRLWTHTSADWVPALLTVGQQQRQSKRSAP